MLCDLMRERVELVPDNLMREEPCQAMDYTTSALIARSSTFARGAMTRFNAVSGELVTQCAGVPVEQRNSQRCSRPVAWMLWWVCLISVPAYGPVPEQPDEFVREPGQSQPTDRPLSWDEISETAGFISHKNRWTSGGSPSDLVTLEGQNEKA